MGGPAAKAPEERRRRTPPERGEWQNAQGSGWQHGRVPPPPPKMLPATTQAWATWFASWFASYWTPADIPGLRMAALLYNGVQAGDLRLAGESRRWLDAYGITPEGQQDRRWAPPKDGAATATATGKRSSTAAVQGPYGHLSVVRDEELG